MRVQHEESLKRQRRLAKILTRMAMGMAPQLQLTQAPEKGYLSRKQQKMVWMAWMGRMTRQLSFWEGLVTQGQWVEGVESERAER
jgi:hypothetical protein